MVEVPADCTPVAGSVDASVEILADVTSVTAAVDVSLTADVDSSVEASNVSVTADQSLPPLFAVVPTCHGPAS